MVKKYRKDCAHFDDIGLIHTRHFDTQYCDKKIGKGKLLTNQDKGTLWFVKSLPWLSLKSMAQKYLLIGISFYLFIAILYLV